MAPNPFLSKKPKPIRWQSGPAKGTVGIPALDENRIPKTFVPPPNGYKKKPTGRKPKKLEVMDSNPDRDAVVARGNWDAGRLAVEWKHLNPRVVWGSTLDVLTVAHGAVGCSAFALTQSLNLPGFVQGAESFTALDACTDLKFDDLDDNGNAKLRRAIDEAEMLFPLAGGIAVAHEEPVSQIGTDILGFVKAKAKVTDRLIITSSYGSSSTISAAKTAAIKAAQLHREGTNSSPYDVVLTDGGRAPGNLLIVEKLLRDIGLKPVHAFTGLSSTDDLARIARGKLIIGLHPNAHVSNDFGTGGSLHQLFGTPLIWTCFVSPSATDASLRAIASRFDWKIQRNVETVIAANQKKTDAIVALYRPRLEGKLCLNLNWLNEEQLQVFRLLGLRIGEQQNWPGKTGIPRVPRIFFNGDEKSLNSYISEAKPDIAYFYGREPDEWRKRGLASLSFSPLSDKNFNSYWGYDGFALFAAAIDRHINAPWRKLVKPPWPDKSG